MVNTFILGDTPDQIRFRTAGLLDTKRLGKQRLEAKEGKTQSYSNHPITQMWKGSVPALKHYFNCMVKEWIHRGYNNTLSLYCSVETMMPWWFYCKQLQLSHWCALLLKDRSYYEKTFGMNLERWAWIQPYLAWGYLYPHRLNSTQITTLQQGTLLPPAEVCAPLGQGIPPQTPAASTGIWSKCGLVIPF